jgi:hypothetical protein
MRSSRQGTPSRAGARRQLIMSVRYLDFLDHLAASNPSWLEEPDVENIKRLPRRIAGLVAWLAALRALLSARPEPGTRRSGGFDDEPALVAPLHGRLPVMPCGPPAPAALGTRERAAA